MALIETPLPNKNVAPPGLKEEMVNRHSVSCNSDISCLNRFPNCDRLRGQILFELLCPTRNFSSHAIAPGCKSETNCDAPNCRLFLGASILIAAWLCPKEREPGSEISPQVNLNRSPGLRRQSNPISTKTAKVHHSVASAAVVLMAWARASPSRQHQIGMGSGGRSRCTRSSFPGLQVRPGSWEMSLQGRVDYLSSKKGMLGNVQRNTGFPVVCPQDVRSQGGVSTSWFQDCVT